MVAEEQEIVMLKGIPRPVQCYRVIRLCDERADDQAEGEGVIRHEQIGIHLMIDRSRLEGPARAEAIKALEEAAAKLKG